VEARLQRGQSDIDDRAIDESHAGADNGGRQDPRSGLGTAGIVSTPRLDYNFIAWRLHADYGCLYVSMRSKATFATRRPMCGDAERKWRDQRPISASNRSIQAAQV
jgi:uncharacterized membrane protein